MEGGPGQRRLVQPSITEDPDDRRIRELAIAINREAGSVGSGRAIVEFYALSLAGALVVVSIPLAATAANEYLLGSAEERLFYESWKLTEPRIADYIARFGGRVITQTRLGGWLVRFVGFGDRPLATLSWRLASRLWAWGAGGTITIILSATPNQESFLFTEEMPRLLDNLKAFVPFRYF